MKRFCKYWAVHTWILVRINILLVAKESTNTIFPPAPSSLLPSESQHRNVSAQTVKMCTQHAAWVRSQLINEAITNKLERPSYTHNTTSSIPRTESCLNYFHAYSIVYSDRWEDTKISFVSCAWAPNMIIINSNNPGCKCFWLLFHPSCKSSKSAGTDHFIIYHISGHEHLTS